MKSLGTKVSKGLNIRSKLNVADNSGAKIAKIVAIKGGKGRKGRQMSCGLGDLVKVSIREGTPEMKNQVFWAVIIRQKKPCRRLTGERIAFEDNSVVLLKDEEGNPKGTRVKGPIAKEAASRWPFIAKIANIVL